MGGAAGPDADSGNRRRERWVFVVALLPIAFLAIVVNHYAVNVPYGDDWSNLPLLEKCDRHQSQFSDLYRPHNEHRPFFPRLIYLAVGRWLAGDHRVEMLFSILLCVAASAILYLLLRQTLPGSRLKTLTVWALLNLLLFSPIQAENWLWGFQLQLFLANLCLVGAVFCIHSNIRLSYRIFGAVICALVGTFSFGSGLLIWPALLLLLVLRREKFAALLSWVIISAAAGLIYFAGAGHRPAGGSEAPLVDYALYFAAFLGTPLARIPNSHRLILPVAVGVLLFAAYLATAVIVLRRRQEWQRLAPWLVLGAYAIGSAILTTAARAGFGPYQALDSRYTTMASFLLLSLIGIGASSSWGRHRSIAVGATGAVLALYLLNLPFEFRYMEQHMRFRLRGKAALHFSSVLNSEQMVRANLLFRETEMPFSRYVEVLDRLHLLDPPRCTSPLMEDAEARPTRSTFEYGQFEKVTQIGPNQFSAHGWMSLPNAEHPPVATVLAYADGDKWVAFELSDSVERRPDLVDKFKSSRFLNAGWRHDFQRFLSLGESQAISAWTFDSTSGEAYRVPGSFVLTR